MNNIDALIKRARILEGGELIDTLTREQIESAFNGIGADWMPEALRENIDSAFDEFLPAALLHDCQYQFETDRNNDNRNWCDKLFMSNCLVLCDERYPWYRPKRYIHRRAAEAMYQALLIGGSIAWAMAGK